MGLIGRGWKLCEGWSRPVLIGRGLAHNTKLRLFGQSCCSHPLCDPEHTTSITVGTGISVPTVMVCSVLSCEGWEIVDSVVGGCGGGVTPGPIPNPEAKPSSADGTALARVWESRSPPTSNVSTECPAG